MQVIDKHEQTEEAQQAYLEKMEQMKEDRMDRIMKFICEHPGETAYSLSNKLDIPRSSMIEILEELEEDLEIKFVKEIENGRLKKKVYPRTLNDFTYTHFHENTLKLPLVQKLIRNAQEKGESIIIELENGKEKVFSSNEDIFIALNITK